MNKEKVKEVLSEIKVWVLAHPVLSASSISFVAGVIVGLIL